MSRENDYVYRAARCIRASEKALLVETQFGRAWIPKKCISDRSGVFEKGDDGLLVVSRWLAEQPGKECLRQR
jgi:hypothetical protein